jgi:hypothetical protein
MSWHDIHCIMVWNYWTIFVVHICKNLIIVSCLHFCKEILKYIIVLTVICFVPESRSSWAEFCQLPPSLLAQNMRQFYAQDARVRLQKDINSSLKFFKGGPSPLRGIPPSRMPGTFKCPGCNKSYWYKKTMLRHLRLECGKEPQFQCPYCAHRAKQKNHLVKHVASRHKDSLQEFG